MGFKVQNPRPHLLRERMDMGTPTSFLFTHQDIPPYPNSSAGRPCSVFRASVFQTSDARHFVNNYGDASLARKTSVIAAGSRWTSESRTEHDHQ